jgi:outer membrane PBP1 activator LpoA protein
LVHQYHCRNESSSRTHCPAAATVGKQQAAGVAVRDGFIAAALWLSKYTQRYPVFDTNQAGALDAYQRAVQAGASIVVGPLLKKMSMHLPIRSR